MFPDKFINSEKLDEFCNLLDEIPLEARPAAPAADDAGTALVTDTWADLMRNPPAATKRLCNLIQIFRNCFRQKIDFCMILTENQACNQEML